jgi:hypothetical protein
MAIGRLESLRCKSVERSVENTPLFLYAYHSVCFDRGTIAKSYIDVTLRSRDRNSMSGSNHMASGQWAGFSNLPWARTREVTQHVASRSSLSFFTSPSRRWPLWTEPVKCWRKAFLLVYLIHTVT